MTISKEKIIDKFDYFKTIYFYPTLFLYKYFDNIKNEINTQFDFVKTDKNLIQKKNLILNKVNQLEDECVTHCPDDTIEDLELDKQLSNLLEKVEIKLNEIKTDYSSLNDSLFEDKLIELYNESSLMDTFEDMQTDELNHLDDKLDEMLHLLKEYLFMNSTIMYLNRKECEKLSEWFDLDQSISVNDSINFELNETPCIGILLYFNNYISDKKSFMTDMDIVLDKSYTKLTPNLLKLIYITPILKQRIRSTNNFQNGLLISIDLECLFKQEKYKLSSTNYLNELSLNLFHEFKNLKELYIDLINLRKIENLSIFSRLNYLYIKSDNLFQKLDYNILKSSLTRLRLWNKNNSPFQIIKKSLLSNMKNLKDLILSNCSIEAFDIECFYACEQLETIDLSMNKLKKFNFNLFSQSSNLKVVNLTNNLIESIDYASKSLSLETLNLDGNKLSSIKSFYFNNLENLKILTLRSNNINEIELNSFDNLINLIELTLAYNCIRSLPHSVISNLKKLTSLDLKSNQIKLIEKDNFKMLKSNLKNLDLSLNKINEIEQDSFNRLKSLELLNLAFNEIILLERHLFRYLTKLKQLNLSHNRLEIIKSNYFFIMDKPCLKMIDLSCNFISCYEKDCFYYLKNIKFIFLHGNSSLQVHNIDYQRNKNCFKYKLPLHHIIRKTY